MLLLKRIERCILILGVLILFVSEGHADSDLIDLFDSHVLDGYGNQVKNIKYGQVSCMHCPLFYSFDSSANVIDRIVISHKMKSIDYIPNEIVRLNSQIRKQVNWWSSSVDFKNMNKYAVSYLLKGSESRLIFTWMAVDDQKVYYIVSGFPSKKDILIDEHFALKLKSFIKEECNKIDIGDSSRKIDYLFDKAENKTVSNYGEKEKVLVFWNRPQHLLEFNRKPLPEPCLGDDHTVYGNYCEIHLKNSIVKSVKNGFISDVEYIDQCKENVKKLERVRKERLRGVLRKNSNSDCSRNNGI
ncbi:MAG: hypothetical protein D6B27_05820 [Gammaproteobacteria bacterium]|nr:MAG: hypothetical protein D6B27_05820 [Gammaproteobacteria bacterium]